jgi:hypothetical protein
MQGDRAIVRIRLPIEDYDNGRADDRVACTIEFETAQLTNGDRSRIDKALVDAHAFTQCD